MTPAIGLLVIGGILLVSGWKGASIVDTFAGKFPDHNPDSAAAATPDSPSTPSSSDPIGVNVPAKSGTYGALESGLSYAGPDQGIDFTGSGSIFAPVKMQITRVDLHSGWPGGHIIVAKLLEGAHAGRFVYFAEALNPVAHLRKGLVVGRGQKIADLNSSYPGTEIGWAQDRNGTAYGTTSDGKAGGPTPRFGISFGNWIKSLTRNPRKASPGNHHHA